MNNPPAAGSGTFDSRTVIFVSMTARILVRGALAMPVTPISGRVPYDPHLLRLDLLQLKVMDSTQSSLLFRCAQTFSQLDLADEIGIMVYEESFASWEWGDSPKMPERFNNSIIGHD